jgi:hypothetical protein
MTIEDKLKEMRSDKQVENCDGQHAMEIKGVRYCMANMLSLAGTGKTAKAAWWNAIMRRRKRRKSNLDLHDYFSSSSTLSISSTPWFN